MILSAQSIRQEGIFTPFHERTTAHGMTFGLGPAGYDVRVAEAIRLAPGDFALASTMEHFAIPDDVLAIVHDKSTWARRGLCVQNTVAEPGWRGYLTLELTNHGSETLWIEPGSPIAQIVLHRLDERTERPYTGKYQDQRAGVVPAILALGDGSRRQPGETGTGSIREDDSPASPSGEATLFPEGRQNGMGEAQATPEISWDIGDDVPPDLASSISAEIIRLKWAHGRDEDEHCYRYGELQEIIDKVLKARSSPPPPDTRGAVGGETFETIRQWCEETFGPVAPDRIATRATEEMDELRADPTRVEEAADVVIVLARHPDLWAAVERKMAVNRARKWRLMGDGTGYHVKDTPTPSEPTVDQGAPASGSNYPLRVALEPFATCCDGMHGGVPSHLDDMASVLHLIRSGDLTITGVSVGDLRRASEVYHSSPVDKGADLAGRQEVSDYFDYAPWTECWECGGEGRVNVGCIDGACLDQDDPHCPDCSRRCDVCHGKGGWMEGDPDPLSPEATDALLPPPQGPSSRGGRS